MLGHLISLLISLAQIVGYVLVIFAAAFFLVAAFSPLLDPNPPADPAKE